MEQVCVTLAAIGEGVERGNMRQQFGGANLLVPLDVTVGTVHRRRHSDNARRRSPPPGQLRT